MADAATGRTTRRPTLADVAARAGVSKALVSIVMRGAPGASEATRARVHGIADELGYVPDQRARKLRQTTSRLIGVTFELQQPFHGDLVEHLYAAADRRGYDLAISAVAPTRPEHTAIDALLRERCEVAVLLGSRLDGPALTSVARRVPTLVVARASGTPEISAVRGDDVLGIGLAVDHLVALGHRRIAHIDGADAPGSADRRHGFRVATDHHGISAQCPIVTGGPSEPDGARATRELLEAPTPPTAITAFNDRCATGVLDTLLRSGIAVPGQVSVVGYDDSRLAAAPHTQLTTISQHPAEMAEAAIAGALDLVGGAAPAEVVLTPRLVPRATSGPAPHL